MRSYLKGILILVVLTFAFVHSSIITQEDSSEYGEPNSEDHPEGKSHVDSTDNHGGHKSNKNQGDHN